MAGVSGRTGEVPGVLVGLGVPSKTGGPHQGSVMLPFAPESYSHFFHGCVRGPKHPKGWKSPDHPLAGVKQHCTTSSSGPFRLHNARRGPATTTNTRHGLPPPLPPAIVLPPPLPPAKSHNSSNWPSWSGTSGVSSPLRGTQAGDTPG